MDERFEDHPTPEDEGDIFQPLLIGVTDFVLKVGCKGIQINRPWFSWLTAHSLEWHSSRRPRDWTDIEICDITSCAVEAVNKVKEI